MGDCEANIVKRFGWPLVTRKHYIISVYLPLSFLPRLCVGGALHIHSSTLVSVDWLVSNVTYRPHCYICFTSDRSVRFVFSAGYPWLTWDCSYWYLLETLRAKMGDPAAFDNRLIPKLLAVIRLGRH